MITAVDTNVLVDILAADERFGVASSTTLRAVLADGSVVACEAVWAEVAGLFPSAQAAHDALAQLGVEFSALTEVSAIAAGVAWREYRRGGGRRDRVVADFLIGAHAAAHADRLLTRDRGVYRTYFTDLPLLEPGR